MKHIILALFCIITFSIATTSAQEATTSRKSEKEKRELKIEGDTGSHQQDMQKLQENLKKNKATFDKIGKEMEAKKERQSLIENSIVEIVIGVITALIASVILVIFRKKKK